MYITRLKMKRKNCHSWRIFMEIRSIEEQSLQVHMSNYLTMSYKTQKNCNLADFHTHIKSHFFLHFPKWLKFQKSFAPKKFKNNKRKLQMFGLFLKTQDFRIKFHFFYIVYPSFFSLSHFSKLNKHLWGLIFSCIKAFGALCNRKREKNSHLLLTCICDFRKIL